MPTDRVALLTGASRGIGAAVGRRLARDGAAVVLAARDEDRLSTLSTEITDRGGRAVAATTDVTVPADLVAAVDLATERFGRLDVVVANAGYAVNAALVDAGVADWDRMIDVNLRGVLHTFAAAVPVLVRQGSGHVVVIGSTSGTKWVPTQGVYAATKAGVRAVTDVLRQELAPTGVRVTLVSPGFTHTDLVESTRDPAERAALLARRDELAMSPDAVAEAVAYAVGQPAEVDVGELVVRPTRQP